MKDHELLLNKHLLNGETVLWTGRPDPAVNFTKVDRYLVPFYLVFAAFVTVMIVTVANGARLRGGGEFPLFILIIFAGAALYSLVGRFFVKRWLKSRITYAITSRRAIVLKGSALSDSPVAGVSYTESTSNRGHVDVSFGRRSTRRRFGDVDLDNTGMDFLPSRLAGVAFFDVADSVPLLAAIKAARA